MLSPEREGLTTASVAPLIVHGTDADRLRLWRERIGEIEREDLSEDFAVQWGAHNEGFCLDWVERTTQREITERQRFVKHPTLPFGATLDGYRPFDDAVVECKVLSPFSSPNPSGDDKGFLAYYAPQVAVQIACRQCTRGYLAVQQGNSAPQLFELMITDAYTETIFATLAAFQLCVEMKVAPADAPPPPVLPEKWRIVNLDASDEGNWGPAIKPALRLWSDTRATAAMHEEAKKSIKELLPPDVGRCTYGPFTIRRARNNAVTIVEAA